METEKIVKIDAESVIGLINTMKGIAPANYESCEHLVACVNFLIGALNQPEEEVKTDG